MFRWATTTTTFAVALLVLWCAVVTSAVRMNANPAQSLGREVFQFSAEKQMHLRRNRALNNENARGAADQNKANVANQGADGNLAMAGNDKSRAREERGEQQRDSNAGDAAAKRGMADKTLGDLQRGLSDQNGKDAADLRKQGNTNAEKARDQQLDAQQNRNAADGKTREADANRAAAEVAAHKAGNQQDRAADRFDRAANDQGRLERRAEDEKRQSKEAEAHKANADGIQNEIKDLRGQLAADRKREAADRNEASKDKGKLKELDGRIDADKRAQKEDNAAIKAKGADEARAAGEIGREKDIADRANQKEMQAEGRKAQARDNLQVDQRNLRDDQKKIDEDRKQAEKAKMDETIDKGKERKNKEIAEQKSAQADTANARVEKDREKEAKDEIKANKEKAESKAMRQAINSDKEAEQRAQMEKKNAQDKFKDAKRDEGKNDRALSRDMTKAQDDQSEVQNRQKLVERDERSLAGETKVNNALNAGKIQQENSVAAAPNARTAADRDTKTDALSTVTNDYQKQQIQNTQSDLDQQKQKYEAALKKERKAEDDGKQKIAAINQDKAAEQAAKRDEHKDAIKEEIAEKQKREDEARKKKADQEADQAKADVKKDKDKEKKDKQEAREDRTQAQIAEDKAAKDGAKADDAENKEMNAKGKLDANKEKKQDDKDREAADARAVEKADGDIARAKKKETDAEKKVGDDKVREKNDERDKNAAIKDRDASQADQAAAEKRKADVKNDLDKADTDLQRAKDKDKALRDQIQGLEPQDAAENAKARTDEAQAIRDKARENALRADMKDQETKSKDDRDLARKDANNARDATNRLDQNRKDASDAQVEAGKDSGAAAADRKLADADRSIATDKAAQQEALGQRSATNEAQGAKELEAARGDAQKADSAGAKAGRDEGKLAGDLQKADEKQRAGEVYDTSAKTQPPQSTLPAPSAVGEDTRKPGMTETAGYKPFELGAPSEKYETGGRGPGMVSSGRGDHGGVSYGSYQLSTKQGSAKEFADKGPYAADFKGLKPGTPEFGKKWQEVAARDPEGFKRAQHDYIKGNLYDRQNNALSKKTGFDITKRAPALQDAAWSTAVQHGGGNDVIQKAYKNVAKTGAKPSDPDFDRKLTAAIYAERGREGRNGKLARFGKSSLEVSNGVRARYKSEEAEALARFDRNGGN